MLGDKGEELREEIFVHVGLHHYLCLHHYPSTSPPRWTNIPSLFPRMCLPTRFTSIHIPVDLGTLTAPSLNFVQSIHKLSSTLFLDVSERRNKTIQPGAPACLCHNRQIEKEGERKYSQHTSESCVTRLSTHAILRRHVLQGKPNPPQICTYLWSITPIPREVLQDTRATALPQIPRSKYDNVYMLMSSVKHMHRLANRRVCAIPDLPPSNLVAKQLHHSENGRVYV